MPPVSSVLTTPSTASQLSLRRRQPSHSPQPSGKARPSANARNGPRLSAPLSFINTTAGTMMVTAISISGLGLDSGFIGGYGWAQRLAPGIVTALVAALAARRPAARGYCTGACRTASSLAA